MRLIACASRPCRLIKSSFRFQPSLKHQDIPELVFKSTFTGEMCLPHLLYRLWMQIAFTFKSLFIEQVVSPFPE